MFSVLSDKQQMRAAIDPYPVGCSITTYNNNYVKMTFGLKLLIVLDVSIKN